MKREIINKVIGLLAKVAEAFLLLNKAAVDLAAGRPSSVDLTDAGEVARIEREAEDVEWLDSTFPKCIPHPYGQLSAMRAALGDIDKRLKENDVPDSWLLWARSFVEQTALLRDGVGIRLFSLAELTDAPTSAEVLEMFKIQQAEMVRMRAAIEQNGAKVEALREDAQDAFRRGEADIADAMEDPAKMAAALLTLAREEMSADGVALWCAYTKSDYSINAAAKVLKKPYANMNRLFHKEVDPFMARHGLVVKKDGRRRSLEFNDKTDRRMAKDSLAGYHGPHTVGDEDSG